MRGCPALLSFLSSFQTQVIKFFPKLSIWQVSDTLTKIGWGGWLYAVIIEILFINEATESVFLFPRINIYLWSKEF